MGESKVSSLWGGPTGQREVNQSAVENIEKLAEQIRPGEVAGFAVAFNYFDGVSGAATAGNCVGLSIIGALENVKLTLMKDDDQ